MADGALSVDVHTGFVDKRRTQGSNTNPLSSIVNYATVASMKTRLNVISSTSYTAARMNTMTLNDLTYAIRVADDKAGI